MRRRGKEKGAAMGEAEEVERELALLLRRSWTLSKNVARAVHPLLEPSAYGVLVYIAEAAPVRPRQVGVHFGLNKSTMSRQLGALKRLGLVRSRPDDEDGRAQLVELSPAGRQRLRNVQRRRRAWMSELIGSWREEDVAEFGRLLAMFNQQVGIAVGESAERQT